MNTHVRCLWCTEITSSPQLCPRCRESERQISYTRLLLAWRSLLYHRHSGPFVFRRRLMLILSILRHHPQLGLTLISVLVRRGQKGSQIGHVFTDEPIYGITR
jgi:hypothetical protein